MRKRDILAILLVFVMLFAFTACDDSSSSASEITDEKEIISAIDYACAYAILSGDYNLSYSSDNLTMTYTFTGGTYSVSTSSSDSDISVKVSSGSTLTYVYDSSYTSCTVAYNVTATVAGTKHTLYLEENMTISGSSITSLSISEVKLDGVDVSDIYS